MLDKYFDLENMHTNVTQEDTAGITIFLSMAYCCVYHCRHIRSKVRFVVDFTQDKMLDNISRQP